MGIGVCGMGIGGGGEMSIRNFYLLKGTVLWCAVPFVNATDGRALLLVGVVCFLAAPLFSFLETE